MPEIKINARRTRTMEEQVNKPHRKGKEPKKNKHEKGKNPRAFAIQAVNKARRKLAHNLDK